MQRKVQRGWFTSPILLAALAMLGWTLSPIALGNTSSVFSPDVDEGEREWEYRSSYIPDDAGSGSTFSHRLHFQYAFDGAWRARLIGAQRRLEGDSWDYRYTRLELQWQYLEDTDGGWDAAIRFEGQYADDGSDRFRIAWTGKRNLDDRWQLRFNALAGRQLGSGAADGVFLETRAQLTYKLDAGPRVGLEMFNDLNTTEDFGGFDEQEQQLGPVLKTGIGDRWNLFLGYLYGISDAADDHDFRMMLTLEM